ncbi:MAG: glycosyltransferase family 1 protein [Acidobacteriota bacterium]
MKKDAGERRLRVVIDGSAFENLRHAGQRRYLVDLLTGLYQLRAQIDVVLLGSPGPAPDDLAALFGGNSRWARVGIRNEGGWRRHGSQLRYASLIRSLRPDVFHALHTMIPLLTRVPIVATVYDLMFELFDEYEVSRSSREWRQYRWSVRRGVKRLISISETTAADLTALWHVPADRIDIIHLGTGIGGEGAKETAELNELVRKHPSLVSGQWILSPYNLERRKNLETLMVAFAGNLSSWPDSVLVLFGRAAVDPERERLWRERAAALGIAGRIVLTGPVSDETLALLYGRSAAFVFPSLYEGFGLPLLEAMKCGACVIARKASAMQEIVGDSGLLVETADPAAISGAMARVLGEDSLNASLRDRARKRASQFTIASMAAQTLQTYRRATGGRRGKETALGRSFESVSGSGGDDQRGGR